jgi:hypothetical protein
MTRSVDGRLLVDRWTPPSEAVAIDIVHRVNDDTAAPLDAEGCIVGRTTMAEIVKGPHRPSAGLPGDLRPIHVGDRNGRDLAVAESPDRAERREMVR